MSSQRRISCTLLFLCSALFVRDISAKTCYPRKPGRRLINQTLTSSDVLVSATVKRITVDANDASVKSFSLEVRRVFKGEEYISKPKEVALLAKDSVQCLPSLGNTRIFSLSSSLDSLYLEEILPINLQVLDALHAFVHGFPHRKRRRVKHTHCESFLCPLGSKCVVSTGECECRSVCRGATSPVCGDDDVTYASLCHLSVRSCLLNKNGKQLRLKHRGNCRTRNPCEDLRCGPGEDCVVSQNDGVLSGKCVCPKDCPNYGDAVESSPVCASNGIDYRTLCHMKQHACSIASNLTVKYFGKCDPCSDVECPIGTTCHLSSTRKPECRCSEQCSLNLDPVCANDGKTYSNECAMKVTACKEERSLTIFRKGPCEADSNPCTSLKCSHGAVCKITDYDTASCECRKTCPQLMKPVCATNGMTFDNECEIERYACSEKARISMKHEGTCGVGACSSQDVCTAPEVCQLVGGRPVCVCPECEEDLREVCASDGRTYPNECKMRRNACLLKKEIFVKYNGICEGCEKKDCEFYSICHSVGVGKGECRCPSNCPWTKNETTHSSTVCGTDGVTYSSECHLRRSACQQRKFIVVAFEGKCDACLQVECRYGEECRGGVCVCSYNCPSDPDISMRVCGGNGVLYPSECHLQLASCQKGSPISPMPLVHCHSDVTSFQDSCQCNRVGSYGPACDLEGKCRCRPGVGGAKCDHCLPSFWGIHLIANGALSCQPCGCSAFGSSRTDCEQTTGRCECRRGAFGEKCNKCTNDQLMTPNGCVPKAEYKTPGTCSSTKCHHGAVCVDSPGGLPVCRCGKMCSSDHLGIAANMTVCGSDGVTYENRCQLLEFACRYQLDIVVRALGICDDDVDVMAAQDRRGRGKEDKINLGSFCTMPSDCEQLNAVCLTRPGRRGVCTCVENVRTVDGKCEDNSTGTVSPYLNLFLSGRNGSMITIQNLTLFMNISMSFSHQTSNGVLLYAKGENGDLFHLKLENRRIVVELGGDSLYSREHLGLHVNHTIHLSWRGNVARVQTGDSQLSSRIETKDQSVPELWLGSDGSNSYESAVANINWLTINGVQITKNRIVSPSSRTSFERTNVILPTVSFDSTGFLEYPNLSIDVRTTAEVKIMLKPKSTDGLAFYWGTVEDGQAVGDFMALFLVASQPHFLWNLGSGITHVKAAPISSREYSTVTFGRNLRDGYISINDNAPIRQESMASNRHLDVSGESAYLGGIPSPDMLPMKLRQLKSSFEGSIQWVSVNEELLDSRQAVRHGSINDAEPEECANQCGKEEQCYEKGNSIRCRDSASPAVQLDGLHELAFLNKAHKSVTRSNVSQFSLSFRTSQSDGILWWESTWSKREDGDFLVIFLKNRKLRVALNLGNDLTFKSVPVKAKIQKDRWYRLEVKRIDRKLTIFLDGKEALTVIATPGSKELDTNGIVYLGGRNTPKATIGVSKMFVGCLRNVTIHYIPLNMVHDTISDYEPNFCE